jgi:hypothetical protein
MRDGPLAGLEFIDSILSEGQLTEYHLAHAARADMCRRLRRTAEARESYQKALPLARQEPERRFLERRLRELGLKQLFPPMSISRPPERLSGGSVSEPLPTNQKEVAMKYRLLIYTDRGTVEVRPVLDLPGIPDIRS